MKETAETRKEYWENREAEKAEKKARVRSMVDAGYSRKEVSDLTGLSEAVIRTML